MADGKEPRKHNSAYQNTISAQAYENAMDNWVLQTAINRQATDLLNEQRKDDYNFQNEQFNFQMDEQIRAYEHSKNIFDRNAEAVDMEVQFQKDQIYSNADSRLQELYYQQGDLDAAYARDSINNSFNAGNLSLSIKQNDLEQQQRTDRFGTDLALNAFNQQARADQFGTNMELNRLSQQARTEQYNTNLKINSLDQQLRTDAFNTSMLLNDQDTAARNNQFGADMKAQSRQISQEQAEGRVELLQASLAADASEASSLASGKRGQTAALQAKAIQTAASINQGALMDQLRRGVGSFADVTTTLTTSKQIADKTSSIERSQLEKTYKTESDINKAQRDQLKMSYKTETEISNTERSQLEKRFETDTGISKAERSQLEKSYTTETQVNTNNRKKLENDQAQQAALFGLTVEEYTADTEKLGRMMLDTYSGIDSELERLAQQEFQTRTELYSRMPLPPRMPPRAKPPREIPYEKLAKPTPAPFYDKNTMGTMPEQKQQSGFGTFLSIAGAVAGVAGTVLTAGAALPGAAAGMGMWGAGLSGGGSILGGLGSRL